MQSEEGQYKKETLINKDVEKGKVVEEKLEEMRK
jgi:hypothetical protein